VNTPTTRGTTPAETRRTGRGGCAPFASLPTALADDPTLAPLDKAILLVLAGHAWGGKDACWPSNATIAAKVGRSPGHVKRRLAGLEGRGLIRREPTTENRTGRQFRLLWRDPPAAPMPSPARSPARPESDTSEGKKKERPESDSGRESPPPPAGERTGDASAPPSAEDLARFRGWAAGVDPVLARFGRSALKLAGVVEPAVARVAHESIGEPTECLLPAVASGPPPGARIAARPTRHRRPGVAPSRRRQGPRQLLEGILGRTQAPPIIPVMMLGAT
jgi:hypothetical protein